MPYYFLRKTLLSLLAVLGTLHSFSQTFETLSTNGGNGVGSVTVSKPSGTTENDLLVAVVIIDDRDNFSTPSGWTRIADMNSGNNKARCKIFWKIAGSSEPSSYTFDAATGGSNDVDVSILRYSGVNTSSPIPTVSSRTGSSSPGECPSINTTANNMVFLRVAYGDEDYGLNSLSGHTERVNRNTDGRDPSYLIAESIQVNAGATGTASFSFDGNYYGGATFTIQGAEVSACELNELSLTLNLDEYPEETSWIIQDDEGATVAAGGVYSSESPESTLELNACLADGEYTFTIFDTYSDGICCGFGSGSYTLTDSLGNILASGAEFGASESTDFSLPGEVEEPVAEVCDNGIDDDGDGFTDCADPDCSSSSNCNPEVAIICLEEISEPVICDNCNQSSIISLKLQNSGPDPATNTVVQYTLPANLEFDASVSSSGCTETAGVVTCNVGGISVGERTDAIEIGVRPKCGQTGESADGGALTVDSDELNAGEDFEKKFWFRNGGPNEVTGGSFLDVWPGIYGANPTPDDNCNDLADEDETEPSTWEFIGSVTNMDTDFTLNAEDWAMEFTGTILVPEDGEYSVCAEEIDDGSFHAIDLNYDGDFTDPGEILIDQTKWTGSNQQVGESVYLQKGTCYRIISRFKSANGCSYNTGQGLGGFANFGWGPVGSCPASADFARFVFNPSIQYSSGCLVESDGDGIADIYDLDDDNDGILDVDEMAEGAGSLCYEFYDATPSGGTVDNIPSSGALQTGSVTAFDISTLQETVDAGDTDEYAIRYTGYIWIETEGIYTFYTRSDDGSKIVIDGTDIVTNDGIRTVQERSGTATLAKGIHSLEILFFEHTGGEALTVQYEGPSISKQALPFSILYPCSDTDNDGIANHLDLDSDGDNCADAIEGGGNFIAADLDASERLDVANLSPSGVDEEGIPNVVGASGQQIGTALNSTISTCNPCAGISGTDTDGDGMVDICDQDDDNDGITDLNEMGGSSGSLSYEFYEGIPSGNTVDNIPTSNALKSGTISEINVTNLQTASDPGDAEQYAIRYKGLYVVRSWGRIYVFYKLRRWVQIID